MKVYLLLAAGCLCFLFSCREELEDELSYIQILDDRSYINAFEPIAIGTTSDGGAIVVSAKNTDAISYPEVSISVVDEGGIWLSETTLPDPYSSPVRELVEIDSSYYLFFMDENNYRTYFVRIDKQGNIGSPTQVGGAPTFPLAASAAGNEILLLSYDAEDKRSVLSRLNVDGQQIASTSYTIGEGSDADPLILGHFSQRRSRLPFKVGPLDEGGFYFNGLYNFSLSLVFTNFGDNPTGVIQGQGVFGGISSCLPLGNGNFAITGFQFEQNFVRPSVSISTNGITSSIDLLDRDQAEIKANSPTDIISYTLNEQTYTVVAAETESEQVVLYIYNLEGTQIAAHYIGYINSFTLGDMSVSEDNSLLILGSTFTAGRFERLFVQQLSETRMQEIIAP